MKKNPLRRKTHRSREQGGRDEGEEVTDWTRTQVPLCRSSQALTVLWWRGERRKPGRRQYIQTVNKSGPPTLGQWAAAQWEARGWASGETVSGVWRAPKSQGILWAVGRRGPAEIPRVSPHLMPCTEAWIWASEAGGNVCLKTSRPLMPGFVERGGVGWGGSGAVLTVSGRFLSVSSSLLKHWVRILFSDMHITYGGEHRHTRMQMRTMANNTLGLHVVK